MAGSTALRIVRKYHPNVKKVVDAKRAATITVTENDCAASKSKAPDSCALSTAFCKKHDGAIISLAIAYLIDGDVAVRYRVPSAISREIVSFDRGHYFAPGTYRLSSPVSTEKLEVIRNRKGRKKVFRKKGSHRTFHKTAGVRSL